ncbi:MAG: LacI family DNA-binding transcriptional regulator [Anaerolineae bacterium]
MSVSIKDIARKANVSPSTVSRALNDHPRISLETKEQIRALAKAMGYVPSMAARTLVGKPPVTIGVAISDFLDPFYVDLLSSIEDAVIANDYRIFVSSFYRDRGRELRLSDAFYERRFAGIVVAGSLVDDGYLSQSWRHTMPAVLVNCPSYIFSVSVDQLAGARAAVEHLISLGHCRIAYVTQGDRSNTDTQRLNSYRAVLQEHNIPTDSDLIIDGDGGIAGGIRAVAPLLDMAEPPTAIFCFNDMTAIGVINALQRRGYRVPGDFSVVGFDDIDIASYYFPPITTVRQPVYEMGQMAVTKLFALIRGSENVGPALLTPELVVRDSTAAAPLERR